MDKEGIDRCLTVGTGGLYIDITVTPGSDQDSIGEVNPWRDCLEIRVSAPPKGGEANGSIVDLFGRVFGIDEGITIARGVKSKKKRLFVPGIEKEEAVEGITMFKKDDSG